MKKILISCGLLSLLCAIQVTLYLAWLPSDAIIASSVIPDNRICYISQTYIASFLNIVDSSGSTKITTYINSSNKGSINGLVSGNDGIYLLFNSPNSVTVDRYDFNGVFDKQVYSKELPKDSSYVFSLTPNSRFYDDDYLSVSNEIWLMTIIDGTRITADCIESNLEVEPRNYILTSADSIAVNALYVSDMLVYGDDKGSYHVINENGISRLMDFGENFVPYKPFSFWYNVAVTNLSDISMKIGMVYEYEEDISKAMSVGIIDTGLNNDTMIGGRVKLSELRNFSCNLQDSSGGTVLGVKKNEGERALFCVFDIYTRTATFYDEASIEFSICIIVGVANLVASFLILLIVMLIIRGLLAIRKIIVKQVLVMAFAVILMFYPAKYIVQTLFSIVNTSFICNALGNSLEILSGEIDGDFFAENGLTDDQKTLFRGIENNDYKRGFNDWSGSAPLISSFDFSLEYVEVARLSGEKYHYEYYTNLTPGADSSYFSGDDRLNRFRAADTESYAVTKSTLFGKKWLEITSFITDSEGNQVGFLQVGFRENRISDAFSQIAFLTTLFAVVPATLVALFFSLTLSRLLRPLKALKKGVGEIAAGKVGTTVTLKSNDEFQDIGNSFNEMSVKLDKYFNSINVISKAYEKYLPRDFFKLMGKANVLDINPSERVSLPLTYMFVNIRRGDALGDNNGSFEKLGMIFNSVNEILAASGGVIQIFNDSRVTAVFTGSVSDAMDTALSLSEKFACESFTLTFTVQQEESVIGVVGGIEARSCLMVSPAIEIQSRIDIITERLKIGFIITEKAMNALGENKLLTRKIGRISDFGVSIPAEYDAVLYENYDAYSPELKNKRERTLADFNAMLEAIAQSDFHAARPLAINILRTDRDDAAARYYLDRINERIAENESD